MPTTGPFPRDTQLTAISIAFKNPEQALIAEKVFPRSPPTILSTATPSMLWNGSAHISNRSPWKRLTRPKA